MLFRIKNMRYNFDEIVPRTGTNSYKWDSAVDTDVLPMWVADMDFRTAPVIIETLRQRVEHGIFGYTRVPDAYYEAVTGWFERRHGWQIRKEWMICTSGVVPAISAVIKALTEPGDKVLVQTPVYNCFFSSIRNNGCEIIRTPLSYAHDTFTIDYEDLEKKAADPKVKVMLLCNPHNPVGRVFTGKELEELFAFAARHDIVVVADEIHSDLILEGEHIPAITLNEAARQRVILHHSASKTYNIPGLPVAFAIIPNEKLRHKYEEVAATMHAPFDTLSFVALEAAFTKGEEWRQELLEYLRENKKWLDERISRIPGLSICHSEGTYLGWIDARETGLSDPAGFFMKEAGVKFNDGESFSAPGFIRVNFACPRAYLEEAFDKVEKALDNWKKQEKVY